MSVITSTKPNPKNDKQGFVRFDDNTEAWTPELALVLPLVGKPLPADWKLKDGPHGKQLLPPKQGGQAAWINTKEGAEYAQANRQRWQQIEEEKKDRRTALMQAVGHSSAAEIAEWPGTTKILDIADTYYEWLRVSAPTGQGVDRPKVDTTIPSAGNGDSGDAIDPASPESRPEEVAPAEGLGEGPDAKATPSGHHFTVLPKNCSHKVDDGLHSDQWAETIVIDGKSRCPLCGTPALRYRESTGADLGPA